MSTQYGMEKMLISAAQPSNGNRCVKSDTAQLKERMAAAGTKRRRFISDTSTSSTSTQMTNVSEDSQQQPISPTDFVQSSDGVSMRPVFRLDSQESFETKNNTFMPVFAAGSRTNNGQQPFTCNGMPFSPGYKTNKPTSSVSFEARRAQSKAAKRARPGRRQSESVIVEHRESPTFPLRSHTTTCMAHKSMQDDTDGTCRKHVFDPHRPSGSRLSIDNISSIECQCNEVFPQMQPFSNEISRQTQRARSFDALESLRVHVYDTPDNFPRRDTEVFMNQGNMKPVVTLSRKRQNSSLSETPTEVNNDRDETNDAESGYIRTGNDQTGLCDSLSLWIKRHALTILIVINLLLLFVIFTLFPYLLMRNSKGGPGEKGPSNCFQCSDLPAPMLQASIVNGHIEQYGDRCCFKTDGDWTSWVVQQVSMQSTRPFAYLNGRLLKKLNEQYRIQWEDNPTIPMKLTNQRTAVVVEEKGFYFLFSRVHYHGTDVSSKHSSVTISHSINKSTPHSNKRHSIGMVSQKCRQGMNSTNVEHNSVLETIAYLNEGEAVFIDVQMETLVNRSKAHTFGMFKIS